MFVVDTNVLLYAVNDDLLFDAGANSPRRGTSRGVLSTNPFVVAREQTVVVTLYDASGRSIRELYRGTPQPNELQTLRIDGEGLASGTCITAIQPRAEARGWRVPESRFGTLLRLPQAPTWNPETWSLELEQGTALSARAVL